MEYYSVIKKEWSTDVSYSKDGWTLKIVYDMKKAMHKRPYVVWLHLYGMSRVGKFIKTESELAVT